jgi:hypothetical protein
LVETVFKAVSLPVARSIENALTAEYRDVHRDDLLAGSSCKAGIGIAIDEGDGHACISCWGETKTALLSQ